MFAIGIELPKAYMVKHWKSMFFLLVPVTAWVSIPAIYYFTGLIFNFRVGSFVQD